MNLENARVFFWSDPHFFHKNVIRLCNRPFADLTEMHETLIKNYNSVVGPDDVCVWVGDCFFAKNLQSCKGIMDRLNGRKILVRGNHDFSPRKMLSFGFEYVLEDLWLKIAGEDVQIKHYPFAPSKKEKVLSWWRRLWNGSRSRNDLRYLERRPEQHGQYLIHGHTHNLNRFRGQQIHVGVDAWNFTPVPLSEIEAYIKRAKK
jgi:calcineurin-like phosphoesterase family protein